MTNSKLIGYAALAATAAMTHVMMPEAAIARPAAAAAADLKAEADAIVQAAYPAIGPGIAVIVSRGGEVVYSAAHGLADVDARRPIAPDTPFRLGSMTKQFTAALVLQLVDEGRLSLDDPVSRFFPEWPQPAAGATVRQLLNHTSGIRDMTKIPGWIAANYRRPHTTAELLAHFRDLPSSFEPGKSWEYNNGGYVLLGAIVEKVTGKPWHEVFADRIARPLGLKSIVYGIADEANAAMPKGYTLEDGRQGPAALTHMSVPHAAGGLTGTAADLAKWAHALHNGRVVGPDLYREMISPARLADGSTEPYGFGLRLRRLRGQRALVHGGAIRGFSTDSAYFPAKDLFVAVLHNSDDPVTDTGIVLQRLAALALGDPFPTFTHAELDLEAIEPLFGLYSSESGPPRRFFARDGKLYIARGDGQVELLPAGGDRFFMASGGLTWLRFVRKPDGAHVLEVHGVSDKEPDRAVRTGDVPPPLTLDAAVLQSYVGVYQTELLAVTIALDEKGRLTATPAGQPPMPLRPVSQTEFRIDGTPMRLVFHPEEGKVDRFTLHRGARQLHGVRKAQ